MKLFLSLFILSTHVFAISEVVYVESPTDTDNDGKRDLIFVSIKRPNTSDKLPTLYDISPYSLGGDNSVQNHITDVEELPQNELKRRSLSKVKYAKVSADSVGTGRSTGCPTVGDMSETLAGKAVIDWLNGSARAFKKDGTEVFATWANGNVGMRGVSYNGTLPTMIATTGVKGLKAIVPTAAISNWYNYYRSNGLVVSPGGYIGEDADTLGYYIVRKNACKAQLAEIFKTLDRKTGDYSDFWQARNYLPKAQDIKAATFIVHGQKDWNVRQRHATELWEAITNTPKRMYLFNGGHRDVYNREASKAISDWFDYYVAGVENNVNEGPQVWVQDQNSKMTKQNAWPSEETQKLKFYFSETKKLSMQKQESFLRVVTDKGRGTKIRDLILDPDSLKPSRAIFLTDKLSRDGVISGTSKIQLKLSVLNKQAANITAVIVEYKQNGREQIITRGWADPQNYQSLEQGELLNSDTRYLMAFDIEPKQYTLSEGSRIGVVLTSTDYNHTLRPLAGTKIEFLLDMNSFIELNLTSDLF
jgi:X-Pro dipeptidyl-peptidase